MRRRRERGAVFVVTLAILTVLVAIVASVAATEQIAIKQQANRNDMAKARAIAEAGIQRAVEVLSDEGASGTTTNTTGNSSAGSNSDLPGATTLNDDWASLGTTGNDRFVMKYGSFRMQILDAASRINLNTAALAQLQNLPLLQEQIDSLLDWRSAGETARSDGAKDAYYNGLTNPYDASLVNFSTVSELLDVRYFTPADLWDTPVNQPLNGVALQDFPDGRTPTLAEMLTVDSSSPSVNTQGTAKTALSRVNLQTLSRGPFAAIAQRLYNARTSTTWAALIRSVPTISSGQLQNLLNNYYLGSSTQAGKINVNTANATVLQTISGISQDEAQTIVTNQTTGYTSLGSIMTIPGLTTVRAASAVVDQLCVNSSAFIVRVIGKSGSATVPLEAVLSVTPGASGQYATVKVVRIEDQEFSDMTGRWGWQTDSQNDVQIEAGS
jgi:type II secretory pathway component PulK